MQIEKKFNIPDKHEDKISLINSMVNKYKGNFNTAVTKDGTHYFVEFTSKINGDSFDVELNKLIPNLYEY